MLYIKFKPYNAHTLASLINKTLHFSTVFDFNDLNEYRLFFCLCNLNNDQRQLLITKLDEKICAQYATVLKEGNTQEFTGKNS